MLPLPLAIRLALKLHETWAGRPQPPFDTPRTWRDLDAILTEARRLQNQIRLAARHKLAFTLPRLTGEMPPILDNLVREAEQLRAEFAPATHARPVLSEWVKEVRQLEAEFGAVGPGAALEIATAVDWAVWPAVAATLPVEVADWQREYDSLVERPPVRKRLGKDGQDDRLEAGEPAFDFTSHSSLGGLHEIF